MTRRVVVFAADGGARSAVDYGIFWRAISVPRVSNADALYVLARDTTVVEVESDVVVDAGVESTTYRYAFADDPTIGVEEVHRVRTSTADVVHQWWLYCPGY
ncbi:MAG: hypothetical protein JNM17_21380 [Archangium sp.]|nr:hypothetical protein [Archangium sp.]